MTDRGEGFLAVCRWLVLTLVGLVLILIGSLRYHGPAYRSDEIGYLSKAAALAGRSNTLASSWHGGYSLLLSPFFRLAADVHQAWPAVVIVNVLAVLVALVSYWRCLGGTGVCTKAEGFRLILLALLFLGTTAYTGWAFTNCVMMALIALIALLLGARSPTTAFLGNTTSIGIGLLAGFSYWVHPTGLLVIGAAVLASLWPIGAIRHPRQSALLLLLALPMVWYYGAVVHPWISALQAGGHGHYEGQIREYLQLIRSAPLASLTTLAVDVTNGLATSAIASFGYLGVVVMALPKLLSGGMATARHEAPDRLARVLLFLVATWFGLVVFSSFLGLLEPNALGAAFMQRYSQPVLPGLVVFGMALAPRARDARQRAWLLCSALPILAALLIALLLRTYDGSFSVVDGLNASTIFLDPQNPVPMLIAGLGVTGIVQMVGWRALLPLAAGLWMLGWHSMDRIHRDILRDQSRLPALAEASAILKGAGLRTCLVLTDTPKTPNEYDRTLPYYLSGLQVRRLEDQGRGIGNGQGHCDVILRPQDSGTDPKNHPQANGSPLCRPRLLDTYSSYLLEDCSNGAYERAGMQRRLLRAPRDLVDWARALHLRPPGFRIVAATHTSELPPAYRGRGQRGSLPIGGAPAITMKEGKTLIYGPYLRLPPGTYQAVFDGFGIESGTLVMDVTSGGGKRQHARRLIQVGTFRASLPFQLDAPVEDLEVRLSGGSGGMARLPVSLVIYGEGKGG